MSTIELGFGAAHSADEEIAAAANAELGRNSHAAAMILRRVDADRDRLTTEEQAEVDRLTARNYYLQGCEWPPKSEPQGTGLDTFEPLL